MALTLEESLNQALQGAQGGAWRTWITPSSSSHFATTCERPIPLSRRPERAARACQPPQLLWLGASPFEIICLNCVALLIQEALVRAVAGSDPARELSRADLPLLARSPVPTCRLSNLALHCRHGQDLTHARFGLPYSGSSLDVETLAIPSSRGCCLGFACCQQQRSFRSLAIAIVLLKETNLDQETNLLRIEGSTHLDLLFPTRREH